MRRTLWLNLYGWETVQCKLKNRQKMHFCVLGCFCLASDSLNHIGWATSIHFASIRPTNPRPNLWNFHKKIWELAILKNSVFWVDNFGKKNLLHPKENQSKLLSYQGWVEILMITLVYSKRVSVRIYLLHSVPIYAVCWDLRDPFIRSPETP